MKNLFDIIEDKVLTEAKKIKKMNILLKDGADINAVDSYSFNLLQTCYFYNFLKIAQFLIDKGIYIDYQDIKGYTALHHSCKTMNRTNFSKLLIKNGADIKIRNLFGFTALDLAIEIKNKEIIELLLNLNKDA
jgi:ankyrin repeat protein